MLECRKDAVSRSRLIRRVVKTVEATYGPGVVPLPGRSTLYKVIDAVASGRHTFGSAVMRRQTANRPQGMFTPTHAARPDPHRRCTHLVGGERATSRWDRPLVDRARRTSRPTAGGAADRL